MSDSPAEHFDAEAVVGQVSETPADHFDAEVIVGGWFDKVLKTATKVAETAGQAYVTMQASDGSQTNATPDAMKKAFEMLSKARGGDKQEQKKIEAVAATADKGDPAAQQATTLLSVINDLLKAQAAKSAAQVGSEFDVEKHFDDLDVDAYEWGW